jgi:hypothetical protein
MEFKDMQVPFGEIGYINQKGKIVVAPKFLFGNDFFCNFNFTR